MSKARSRCLLFSGLPKKSCGSDGRSHDPCGIARVDLSGLLDGQRMVEVTVPITNSCSLGEEEEEEEGGVRVGPLGGGEETVGVHVVLMWIPHHRPLPLPLLPPPSP